MASGYPTFSMYSELGSHPGTAGATFFALRSDSDRISYNLQGATVERGFFVSASIVYLWKTCEAVSPAMGWEEWLRSQATPMRTTTSPLMAESLRRRQQQSALE